jgi:hypothetical protein
MKILEIEFTSYSGLRIQSKLASPSIASILAQQPSDLVRSMLKGWCNNVNENEILGGGGNRSRRLRSGKGWVIDSADRGGPAYWAHLE